MSENSVYENPQTSGITELVFDDKKPVLFMFVGLPGSGKSTLAKSFADHLNSREESRHTEIVSSDAIRQELFGDESNQDQGDKVFATAHSRIKKYLLEGKNVIFDATNISKKYRRAFLKDIKSMEFKCECVAMMTPYETCLERNKMRERVVPESVIRRMYLNWEPPHRSEGFDDVYFIMSYGEDFDPNKYSLTNLVSRVDDFMIFDQMNDHHKHTLGVHCMMAMMNIYYQDRFNTKLQIAALLHDTGKMFTRSAVNHKGEYDGNCHYYQHHCVSAYDSLFYLNGLAYTRDEKAHIANLIFYHMHPHRGWKQSEKAKQRDRELMGEDLYFDVLALHKADLASQ